jgi:hypothetical protein
MKSVGIKLLGLVVVLMITAVLIKVFVYDSNDPCKTPNENVETCYHFSINN